VPVARLVFLRRGQILHERVPRGKRKFQGDPRAAHRRFTGFPQERIPNKLKPLPVAPTKIAALCSRLTLTVSTARPASLAENGETRDKSEITEH
jgi:hypothetical protein